jgi:ATP-dependent DNA helicase RecG
VEQLHKKVWAQKALRFLEQSLTPPTHELNELDWKLSLSPDKHRISEHLSAFSNLPGGGFLAYGIDGFGKVIGLNGLHVGDICNTLANIGRHGLEPPIKIDHSVEDYGGSRILFIFIQESPMKPVHLKGKDLLSSFIRSGGTTRPASRHEIGTMLTNSGAMRWEQRRASLLLTDSELIAKLDLEPIFKILDQRAPSSLEDMMVWATTEKFVEREPSGGGYITNLGAITASRALSDFPDVSRKAVRVVVYHGTSKTNTKLEKEGKKGYAVAFQGLFEFVTSHLPQSEVIEQALRKSVNIYPAIALREIIANALIHQDFSVVGAGPMIEIFKDRIEISNPGSILPSKTIDRLIGTSPESRNEILARMFRRFKICEERGSGLKKAGDAVELYGLPPIEFVAEPNSFKVTLHAPRTFAEMSSSERLQACYQHAVLKFFSDSHMTNTSLRERLRMPDKQRSMVSALIAEAVEKNLIKVADPESLSRRYVEYIPSWA